jgi:glycosyltransferase involved in cell wall biosynthesis
MLLLAQGFAQLGFSVDLVLAKAEGPFLKFVPENVRVVDLNAPRVLFSLPCLVRYLRQTRPEAMLSALDHANLVAILARRLARTPTRLVVSVRNTMSLASSNAPSTRGRLVPIFARWLYPTAERVIAVSGGVAEDIIRLYHLPKAQVRVIYNHVVTPELLSKASEPLSHPWFQPGEPPVILGVGRLTQQKDFITLIRAFALVRRQVEARLVILGEGEDRPRLEQLAAELGLQADVALPGFVENPYAFMRRSAVFALSSRWEGFGNVLIEAMACGTRVVATDCLSGPREILEDGKWGKLVPVGNPEALAEAIVETLHNPPSVDPTVRAKEFSLEKAVEAYLDALGLSCNGKVDSGA